MVSSPAMGGHLPPLTPLRTGLAQIDTRTQKLDPYRETAYQRLMLAHAAAGNRASTLLAYERCRTRLLADLGTAPGAAIQALHLDLLRAR